MTIVSKVSLAVALIIESALPDFSHFEFVKIQFLSHLHKFFFSRFHLQKHNCYAQFICVCFAFDFIVLFSELKDIFDVLWPMRTVVLERHFPAHPQISSYFKGSTSSPASLIIPHFAYLSGFSILSSNKCLFILSCASGLLENKMFLNYNIQLCHECGLWQIPNQIRQSIRICHTVQ